MSKFREDEWTDEQREEHSKKLREGAARRKEKAEEAAKARAAIPSAPAIDNARRLLAEAEHVHKYSVADVDDASGRLELARLWIEIARLESTFEVSE